MHQLSIFAPLSWNHKTKLSVSRDSYSSDDQTKGLALKAIQMKEEFLLYHYSLLLRCTVGIKGREEDSHCAYITPLAYHYGPSKKDSIDIYSIEDEFMFGDALLVAPVIEHNEKTKRIYIPNDTFYHFSHGKAEVRIYVISLGFRQNALSECISSFDSNVLKSWIYHSFSTARQFF